ncbi:MAG: CDP-glucose 4,6-dehydratase [Actinomycetota bacterium]|nr:CDP-glucose 4,6-dehydratase [Actinomycetota bacterium]MEE2958715.1 CDP-glucose 4,6-dehydratase [Actinomycetota bacterium]
MSRLDNAYAGRRVLVTGHTGFKGAWLSLWLHHLGAEVAGYSDGVPTQPSAFDLLGLDGLVDHHLGDIRDRSRLAEAIDATRPEVVFHLAAQPLVLQSLADPVETFEVNTMGMVNVLECVRERPWIQAVVLVTSDKAYRNEEWDWGYRETDHLGGHDPYSGSKSCAELVAHSYHHSFLRDASTRMASTRAGNVIGGGDWAADRIVPDCIRAWSNGESVTVRSPRATRPWQHVLEPLSGYLWLGVQLLAGTGQDLDGEAFNFGPGTNQDETVADLLESMAERWDGARWEIATGSEQSGREAALLKLSCDKALRVLDWHAVLTFSETVAMTVDWYRTWHLDPSDMRSTTIDQIDRYVGLANDAGLGWARP